MSLKIEMVGFKTTYASKISRFVGKSYIIYHSIPLLGLYIRAFKSYAIFELQILRKLSLFDEHIWQFRTEKDFPLLYKAVSMVGNIFHPVLPGLLVYFNLYR